jgi:hypothetical protein
MATTNNSALHPHGKQSTRQLGISANKTPWPFAPSTRIFLRGARREWDKREAIGGGARLTTRNSAARETAAYNHSMECQRWRGEGGRPLRSAASSCKVQEVAAATAQAVDEAGLARRALNSAGTDAGAMPPQVRRRSIVAWLVLASPLRKCLRWMRIWTSPSDMWVLLLVLEVPPPDRPLTGGTDLMHYSLFLT